MKTNFFKKNSTRAMLHVAPEQCIGEKFSEVIGDGYLTADLHNPAAMVEMDITSIQYPGKSFDVIYCSHVLEHVQNDLEAMREFHRVLKDDGFAILLVPIEAETTYEDPSITDPQERERAFGQADHVRIYGLDYIERLRSAGFSVTKTSINDLVDTTEAVRMGLTDASGDIFFCTKR
jgi:SAM-dependent methyltransferase